MVTVEERAKQATEKRIERIMEEMEKAGYPVESEEALWKLFPEFLRWRIEEAGEREAQEWNVEAVKEYLYDCRVIDHGNPAFQTEYAQQEFAKDKVLIKCIGGKQLVVDHQWFRNMPPKLKKIIEKGTWEDFARWMYTQKQLTAEEFTQMRQSPFLMRPGIEYPIEKKKRKGEGKK